MNANDLHLLFKIEDSQDLPNAVMNVLSGDIKERDEVYHKLIDINNYDMSFDWFAGIYESELAQRKQNKQDFTPKEPAMLCSLLTETPKGVIHEPTAGNGSMIITDWWNRCQKMLPWEHFPSENIVSCWELSNRAMPILLLNLSIRGIMGYVYHGDVLTREIKTKYILLNRKDSTLSFSEIIEDKENKMIIGKKRNASILQ